MTALSETDFERLRTTRAESPETVARALADRPGRTPTVDGRLFILAADHPARGALGVRSDANAMANRYALLERLALALDNPAVDGVLGTPDILDDLAVLGKLDGKIVVGSMNRGGLRGASFEMDDRFTAYDLADGTAAGLDFAKLLLRINFEDAGSAATLEAAANAVSAAARTRLPIMIEPFISRWIEGHIVNDLDADAVLLSAAIAAGLGNTSAYTWLKLPVVADMERVMAATTLPTVLLGGDPNGTPDETYASWEQALALPGVRGLVVGRTLLYPPDDDVESAVATAARLVHSQPQSAHRAVESNRTQ